jgi:hypothetical protein
MKKVFFAGQISGILVSLGACFTSYYPMGVFFLAGWAGLGIAWLAHSMSKEVWT